MIHPNTELRFVSREIGYGVFATAPIPKGTILYVKDLLDIEITEDEYSRMDIHHRETVEKYSYIDERGVRIVSWDHAKYVNHRCDCNSISTGYGFEIAIRDIGEGEEITDEYGLFNIPFPIAVNCGCTNCRKTVFSSDMDIFHGEWDTLVIDALGHALNVPQPLWHLMDEETKRDLTGYLAGDYRYRSVINLKHLHPSIEYEWSREKEGLQVKTEA